MKKIFGEMKRVIGDERKCIAKFVELLADVDRAKLHIEAGYSRLDVFCMKEFGLSKSSSLKRIVAARLYQRFPEVLRMVEDGELHLSALLALSRHLTNDNRGRLLGMAKGKSEDKIKQELAREFPDAKPRQEYVRWLSGKEVEVTVVFSAEQFARLERTIELKRNKYHDGKIVDVVDDVLKEFLDRNDPLVKKAPRTRKIEVHGRWIRRRIQHETWQNNRLGQCEYLSPDGKRCAERGGLQIDHKIPWALGGSSLDVNNLRLLCGPHNRFLAEQVFGPRPRR